MKYASIIARTNYGSLKRMMTYFVGKNAIKSLAVLNISKPLKKLLIRFLVNDKKGLLKFLHYFIIFYVYSKRKSLSIA